MVEKSEERHGKGKTGFPSITSMLNLIQKAIFRRKTRFYVEFTLFQSPFDLPDLIYPQVIHRRREEKCLNPRSCCWKRMFWSYATFTRKFSTPTKFFKF